MNSSYEAVVSQAPVGRSPTRGREDDNAVYERFMPLVRRIAMRTIRTLPASLTFDDILSAGWVGMAEALQRRTEEMQDEHFEAYAMWIGPIAFTAIVAWVYARTKRAAA